MQLLWLFSSHIKVKKNILFWIIRLWNLLRYICYVFCGIELDKLHVSKYFSQHIPGYWLSFFSNANFIISKFPAEANWESGSADDSVNCTGKCSICAHSWEPQLLLAGYPPLDICSPCSLFLCLRFLSWSLPLQIFFNATEECQNVDHLWLVHRISVFFFQLLLGSKLGG